MELIIAGIISGIITGLGMGGGSFLILVLVSYMGVAQQTAQVTNLLFFIPTAIIALIIHFKNKTIERAIGKKLVFSSVVGSVIGAYIATLISPQELKKYFGIFLLIVRNI